MSRYTNLHQNTCNWCFGPQLWAQKRGENSQQMWSNRFLCLFPLCPLCECLPLAGFPSIPAPNSTLQHCYTTFIMLISWSRGWSGQLQKCTFPCQSGCKLRTGPHTAPQNAEIPENVNGLDITSSILHSGEVKGELNWVNSLLALFWGDFGVGTTRWCTPGVRFNSQQQQSFWSYLLVCLL
jgi:hypothetical protein